jgi:hypothetical protein
VQTCFLFRPVAIIARLDRTNACAKEDMQDGLVSMWMSRSIARTYEPIKILVSEDFYLWLLYLGHLNPAHHFFTHAHFVIL